MSPRKKKIKLTQSNNLKLKMEASELSEKNISKQIKTDNLDEEDSSKKLQTLKRKNFVMACEQVSYKAYFDYRNRFQLLYLPTCLFESKCKHHEHTNETTIKEMPSYAEKSFKIEMKTNMWFEALEVCQMCITPEQYLSANTLKDIVEIILNAHDNSYADYTVTYIIEKCQQILSQHFSTHPPCVLKRIRKCYYNFLTSPMDLKEKTFTNRAQFDCDKGIIKYCFNRLENEISSESKDEALIDKNEYIPEEMKQSIKGMHWQKEKCEIFELLERPERIERLMAILESVIELLQFDLAIWISRHRNKLEYHIMRSQKPLMAYILWSKNVLFTGAVNNNCRQILRLFAYFVHLNYPEVHIRTMTMWLNTMIQTFYICETSSNSDYPNVGKYSNAFANEFYKIISGMPQESIIKILGKIQPSYMQYLISIIHIKKILSTQENDIIKILIDFTKNSKWHEFSESSSEINISKTCVIIPKKKNSILKHLSKKCKDYELPTNLDKTNVFPKFDNHFENNFSELSQNNVICILCTTLESYLDAFSIDNIQTTLENLNEKLLQNDSIETEICSIPISSYSVTETFIKKYRTIYETLNELRSEFEKLNKRKLPKIVEVLKEMVSVIITDK